MIFITPEPALDFSHFKVLVSIIVTQWKLSVGPQAHYKHEQLSANSA